MCSVRNVRLVATGKKQRPAPESIEKQDTRFAESTLRLFVEAIRAGRELPNRETVHKHFYQAAKIIKKWSEKGAKAWASLQVEELRRTAVAVIDAESHGRRWLHQSCPPTGRTPILDFELIRWPSG